jgi:hypothetical protein
MEPKQPERKMEKLEPTTCKQEKENENRNMPFVRKFKAKKKKLKFKKLKLNCTKIKLAPQTTINVKTEKYNNFYKYDANRIFDVQMKICNRKDQLDRVSRKGSFLVQGHSLRGAGKLPLLLRGLRWAHAAVCVRLSDRESAQGHDSRV